MTDNAVPEKKRAFSDFEAIVEHIDVLTPRNKDIRFHVQDDKKMAFKPGQFVQVFVPVEGDPKPRRSSYSIASPPRDQTKFDLCVTLVDGGKSSGFLHHLKVGDRVHVMGPLGKFTLPDPVPRDLVFVATGSGIAPFRSMINHLLENNFSKKIFLVYGNRFDGDIIYQNEWEALSKKHPNFKVEFTLSRPEKWTGRKGYVQEAIPEAIPDPKNKDFYICGLSNMINGVQEKLLSLGVPKEQIHYERYD